MKKLKLQVEKIEQQSSADGITIYSVGMLAQDLPGEKYLPLHPNPRRPESVGAKNGNSAKNGIVLKIIDSIVNNPSLAFPEEIHVVADKVVRNLNPKTGEVESIVLFLLDPAPGFTGHGIVDGGHRQLAIEKARQLGINFNEAKLQLKIYTGLNSDQVVNLSESLNNRKRVKVSSFANLRGLYDFIKDEVDSDDYQIAYHEGQPGVPENDFCRVSHLIQMLISIDRKTFDPENRIMDKAHPGKRAVASGSILKNKRLLARAEECIHLYKGLYYIEELVGHTFRLALEKPHATPQQYGCNKNRQSNITYLARKGVFFEFGMSSAIPLLFIGGARWFVDEEDKWIWPVEKWAPGLVSYIWSEWLGSALKDAIRKGNAPSDFAKDMVTWGNVSSLAKEYFDEYEAGLRNDSRGIQKPGTLQIYRKRKAV